MGGVGNQGEQAVVIHRESKKNGEKNLAGGEVSQIRGGGGGKGGVEGIGGRAWRDITFRVQGVT